MTSVSWLLLVSLALPLVGAIVIWLFGHDNQRRSRGIALLVSLLTLAAAGAVVFSDAAKTGQSFALCKQRWLGIQTHVDIQFDVGLDGLSVWFYGLSALLTLTAVLVSWESIRERASGFYSLLLFLETGMLGVFVARDIILFYIFFEFTLIPLFFLIGIWGSEERRYAAIKFFLFTLAGSVLTFLGLLSIVLWNFWQPESVMMTFSIPELTSSLAAAPMPTSLQCWIFAALFVGFAIKVPLFPLHTWLPLAHVQAPAAGSVLLAGVLLKLGTYGFARLSIPMLPEATAIFLPWLMWLAVAGVIYGALVALAQTDIKRLIAYSSVSHMGFCMLGLFALNRLGVQGGVLQSINHGISTGALFALVGMLYERYHTREIRDLGGIARRTPLLATFMLLFTLSSIGLPGMNGFAGEFLLLAGVFQRAWQAGGTAFGWQLLTIAVLAVSGVVLGAWYMLWLMQRVFFGPVREPHGKDDSADEVQNVSDLRWYDVGALAPLLFFCFLDWTAAQLFFGSHDARRERNRDDGRCPMGNALGAAAR